MHTLAIRHTSFVSIVTATALAVLFPVSADAAVEFQNPAAAGGVPSQATVSATVQGPGDVYVEYAHARTTYATVKDRYVTDGLIAMWDGDDNQGTGAHDPSATTWVDLTGRHSAMAFTSAPTVGANYFDVRSGGGYIADAADIATAVNAEACTIEIVCDVKSLVQDGSLFALTDKDVKRTAWVRMAPSGSAAGVVGAMEYKASSYYQPYPNFDTTLNRVRSYSFAFSTGSCAIYKDGASSGKTVAGKGVSGDTATSYFAIGQRVSKPSTSAAIADMKVYCVRIYDRILTADEISANHAQDVARFFGSAHTVDLDNPGRRTVVMTNFLGTVSAPVTNAKDFYETSGLIAMWDGEDNQGTGAHVAGATTWKDLAGSHADMVFTATPTVGANYYDVSAGGGYITGAADIANAANAEACTIEIVCDVASLVQDGSLFALTDKDVKRIAWVRMAPSGSAAGVVGAMEYKATGSYTPYPTFDRTLNQVRSYSFAFASESCAIYMDGASAGKTVVSKGVSGDAASAYFAIGQRVSQSSQSSAIADMKVYCIRIYDRILSADEIAANHAQDVARFFGASSSLPLGSAAVDLADGTRAYVQNDVATFPLSGLRPDVADYTARLYSPGGTKSAAFDFSTGSEYEDSVWFDYLDSNAPDKNTGPAIDIGFAMNGKVPVVKTKYQLLANENDRFPFGVSSTSSGTTTSTTAGIFNGTADHNQYRYRVGTSGYYADTNVVDLLAVHELELNGPDGTFLNGSLLNADLKDVAEASPVTWGVFARHATDGSTERYQCAKVRMWYFKLWADGTLVRDLVPARKRGNGVGLFDRENGGFYANIGNRDFILGPERPAPQVADALSVGSLFTATLTREGTAASDVSVAWGATFGGGDPSAWDHFEPLATGFAEDATSLDIAVSGINRETIKYVRFYSREDGWSETAYMPEVRTRNPFVLIVR